MPQFGSQRNLGFDSADSERSSERATLPRMRRHKSELLKGKRTFSCANGLPLSPAAFLMRHVIAPQLL